MRLIDVDNLVPDICDAEIEYGTKPVHFSANAIDLAPTVDAVPVVRCKYCVRRYDTDECPMCFLIEGKYYEYTNENGFCDRGERKEGADND